MFVLSPIERTKGRRLPPPALGRRAGPARLSRPSLAALIEADAADPGLRRLFLPAYEHDEESDGRVSLPDARGASWPAAARPCRCWPRPRGATA